MQKIKNYIIGEGRPIICVPVVKKTKEQIVNEVKVLVEKDVQMIEWRVDWYQDALSLDAVREVLDELDKIIKETILLFTFRTKKQGGELAAEEGYLMQLYETAAESGVVDLIDVEFFEKENPQKTIRSIQEKNVKVISSHHDFDETPSAEIMASVLEQMADSETDIAKLAVMPKNQQDVLRLLAVTAEFKERYPEIPVVTMSMGGLGTVSRICGEVFGSCITFGSHEQPSAPGQLQMEKLGTILDYLHETGSR